MSKSWGVGEEMGYGYKFQAKVGGHMRLECRGGRGQWRQDEEERGTGPTLLHFEDPGEAVVTLGNSEKPLKGGGASPGLVWAVTRQRCAHTPSQDVFPGAL